MTQNKQKRGRSLVNAALAAQASKEVGVSRIILAWVVLAGLLSGCGQGSDLGKPTRQVSAAVRGARLLAMPTTAAGLRKHALAASAAAPYGGATPEDAIEQLLDFGEREFATLFPGHRRTDVFQQFRYRFYPDTGNYLGVAVGVVPGDGLMEGGVYVLGEAFGPAPRLLGGLMTFIAPKLPALGGESRLIPAAAHTGAVLHADASAFRPLRAGSVAAYRGSFRQPGTTQEKAYFNTTTQSASPVGGVIERLSNQFNGGPAETALALLSGAVISKDVFELPDGADTPLSYPELRSPLRQREQTVILDRHADDSGIDVDEDGVADAMDIALYSKVIGIETVVLPNLPSVQAVRVDTVLLARLCPSSTGECGAPVQLTQKVWYARGIGIVRASSDVPSENGLAIGFAEERLTAWDSIDQGFGAREPRHLVIPANSPYRPGERLQVGAFTTGFAFANHGLLWLDAGFSNSVFARLDRDGNVLAAHEVPGLQASACLPLQHASGIICVKTDLGSFGSLLLTALDTDGRLIGKVDGKRVDLISGRVAGRSQSHAAAAAGDTVWIAWVCSYRDPTTPNFQMRAAILLRAFDTEGNPRSDEKTVAVFDDDGRAGLGIMSLSAKDDRVLLTWSRRADAGSTASYAATSVNSGVQHHELASGAWLGPVFGAGLLGSGGVLWWASLLDPFSNPTSLAGVRLDGAFGVIRGRSGSFDNERLPGFATPSGLQMSWTAAVALVDDRMLLHWDLADRLWPDLDSPSVTALSWIDVGPGALTSPPVTTVRIARRLGMRAKIMWPDRLLLVHDDSWPAVTLVWLNAGTPL